MRKFWTIVLRIVMLLSFIGIAVFAGIAIISNQSIAYQAYNYISVESENAHFDNFTTDVTTNVKVRYAVTGDEYASFLNTMFTELNTGIDYYLDFLSIENDMTKGDQDALINSYNTYLKNYTSTKQAYTEYMSAYKSAQDSGGQEYACQNVIAKEKNLLNNYISCYESGSSFFKTLVTMVNKYSYSSKNAFSYKSQTYQIKVGISDYAILRMQEQLDNETGLSSREALSYNPNYTLFNNYCSKDEVNCSDSLIITNINIKNYVDYLNCLNIYEWAGNYTAYIASLSEPLSVKASWANSFLNTVVLA